ncbi:MAG: hypothetical protein EXR49_01765 [Dehalococcoidia bacterium]|nr:hypothetical protein [Dehalococcoidia bacterium]
MFEALAAQEAARNGRVAHPSIGLMEDDAPQKSRPNTARNGRVAHPSIGLMEDDAPDTAAAAPLRVLGAHGSSRQLGEGTPPPQVLRVTIPKQPARPHTFFEKYPRNWTWESWAKRMEYEALTVARSASAGVWALLGALTGLAAAGIPALMVTGYQSLVWAPVGAAAGAALGAAQSWWRWRKVFQSHDQLN